MENADLSGAVLNCCSLQQDEQAAFMKVNKYIIYDQLLAALLPAMKHGNVKCNLIDKLLESNTIRKVFEKLVDEGKLDKQVEQFITQYYNEHDLIMF
jgi:predicted metal-dependent phosphotriesterase family hydrolase